jgi:hypothetical protein
MVDSPEIRVTKKTAKAYATLSRDERTRLLLKLRENGTVCFNGSVLTLRMVVEEHASRAA